MYLCSVCGKSFSSKKTLKRHQESTHRQSAGFSCQVCSKYFYRKDVIRKHMKTHQPTVPAESVHDLHDDSRACLPNSTVSLAEEPPPKKHRESHVCNICAKSFSAKKTLKRHQETIHRQSVGFSCQVCSQHFYRKDNLKKHCTRKHPDKKYESPSTYTCDNCQKNFHYETNFREHLKTHQPTLPAAPPSAEPVHDLHGDSLECPTDLLASLP